MKPIKLCLTQAGKTFIRSATRKEHDMMIVILTLSEIGAWDDREVELLQEARRRLKAG